jgi:hypothetical protein
MSLVETVPDRSPPDRKTFPAWELTPGDEVQKSRHSNGSGPAISDSSLVDTTLRGSMPRSVKKFPIDKKQQNRYYGFTAFNKNRQNPTKDGS